MLVPPPGCQLCPRLYNFREQNRLQYPEFFNAPVPPFGSIDAEFLVVGLAPGLKGANQTGRPFTKDYAGLILYHSLLKYGFGKGKYEERADDGFELVNCRITNSVRCVPPENKPELAEINQCNKFLQAEIAAMKNLRVILSLGLISHSAVLKALGYKPSFAKFKHGAVHAISPFSGIDRFAHGDCGLASPSTIYLINSYHSSRYNINTGRLTQEMFDDVVNSGRRMVDGVYTC